MNNKNLIEEFKSVLNFVSLVFTILIILASIKIRGNGGLALSFTFIFQLITYMGVLAFCLILCFTNIIIKTTNTLKRIISVSITLFIISSIYFTYLPLRLLYTPWLIAAYAFIYTATVITISLLWSMYENKTISMYSKKINSFKEGQL